MKRSCIAAYRSGQSNAVLLATAVLGLIQPGASPAVAQGITVMTQNVYAGFDIFRVMPAYNACPDVACKVRVITEAYDVVLTNDFAARAEAIALEVQQEQPHLIGLQESILWRSGPHTDGGHQDLTPDATTVEIDYLATLLNALRAKGLSYEPMVVDPTYTEGGREFPRQVGVDDNGNPILEDIRQNGLGTILARTDLSPSQFQASNPQWGWYASDPSRDWQSVDVMANGLEFRLISTQLGRNDRNPFLAVELLDLEGPAETELPTIVLGDFNLDVDSIFTAYHVLLDAEFTDAWTAIHPGEPGFTCCQAEELTNYPSQLSERHDVVLSRNGLVALDAEIVGEELADRTLSGLWPSDHAGIVVTFGPQLPLLPGDYNQDGTVDAADYVVWRKNDGTQAVYEEWRANFGASLGIGSGSTLGPAEPPLAAVPEPSAICLSALVAASVAICYRRSSVCTC